MSLRIECSGALDHLTACGDCCGERVGILGCAGRSLALSNAEKVTNLMVCSCGDRRADACVRKRRCGVARPRSRRSGLGPGPRPHSRFTSVGWTILRLLRDRHAQDSRLLHITASPRRRPVRGNKKACTRKPRFLAPGYCPRSKLGSLISVAMPPSP